MPVCLSRRVVNTLCTLCTSVAALSRHRVCPGFAQVPVNIWVSDTNLVHGQKGTTNVDILFRTWYPVQIKCAFDIWLRGDGPTPRLDPHSSPVRRPQGPSTGLRRPTTIASAATQAARHASTFGQRQKTLEISVVFYRLLFGIGKTHSKTLMN